MLTTFMDIVHIPLYGITALYCFMQPVTSSAVARRRGGGLRCWSGFWVSCGWRVLHPRVCLRACVGWRGAARASAPLPSTPCSCVYCTFTSATSTAYIASITTTTVISPSNDNMLEQFGGVEANSLRRLLNLHHDHIADELDVMQLSSYFDDDSLNELFKYKSDSFSILGLNCQC